MNNERITVAEAATRLGVTPGRVRHFIADGRLPAERFGKSWSINPDDLAKIERAQGWPKGKPRKP